MKRHETLLRALVWLTVSLCFSGRPAAAQGRYRLPPEDPQWLKLHITEADVGIYSEGVFERAKFDGSTSVDYSRFFIGPSIGLSLNGSIYHPNLARFTFQGEGAWGWGWDDINSSTRNEFEQFGNFHTTLYLLNPKPYATMLSASYDHTFRDYDFFNRTEVDTWRYGGQTGYREGPIPFVVSVWHLDEADRSVLSFVNTTNVTATKTNVSTKPVFGTSNLQQTSANVDAHNDRDNGSTRFNYGFTDYSRTDVGNVAGSTDQTIGLADNEMLGSRQNMTLNSELGYSLRRYTDEPSDDLNANSHLTIDHTPTVSTYYDANYYRSTFGPNTTDNYNGSASLRHQFYESLTSTWRVSALRYALSSSGTNGSSSTTQVGASWGESYTKNLSPWARLTVGGNVEYDYTEVSQSGSVLFIFDEQHIFSDGSGGAPVDRFSLNLPNVDSATIVITDQTRTRTFLLNIDYTVVRNGLLTIITRIAGGSIPQNTTVLASYNAEPSPSGSYNTLNGLVQVRVDFWNGLLGVYGRMNSIQNSGTPGLIVQDLEAFALGADTSWRFLRAGAEYEIYDSNFSSYRSARFFQSLSFRPDEDSSLNFDFTQTFTDYTDAHRQEQLYSFINRYHRRLTSHLGFDLEDGVSLRYGPGVDQTLAAIRPGIDFMMGNLSIKAGCNLEYEQFLNSEQRFKEMFFFRLRRTF